MTTSTEKLKETKENKKQSPDVTKKVDTSLTTQETKVDETVLNKDVVTDQEKEKDKADLSAMFEEKKLKNLKTIEDVQHATDQYGKIMDRYGVDTVLWWLPGGDYVSGVFSTFFFIYQWGKLPKGKNLPWIDRVKIFWLQAVDTFGKPAGKIASAAYLAAQWVILWMAMGPIGAVVWWVAWWVWWYFVWWVLFDYFFKANKRSAQIFNKHCEKLKEEAQNQGMTQEDIAALQKDQEKLKNHFSQNIPVVSDTKTKDGVKDEKEVSPKVVS
jgi:hypothetical protein